MITVGCGHSARIKTSSATVWNGSVTIACCLVVGYTVRIRVRLVSGWYFVMHTYLCDFRLSLSHCRLKRLYDNSGRLTSVQRLFQDRGLAVLKLSVRLLAERCLLGRVSVRTWVSKWCSEMAKLRPQQGLSVEMSLWGCVCLICWPI